MIWLRAQRARASVVTVMGLLCMSAGVDPAAFWEMELADFVRLVRAERARRAN